MSKAIYPYKFIPVPHEKVWGGTKLAEMLSKPFDRNKKTGESWEICGFANESSMIAGGYMAENSLFDLMETYMDEIVGEDNYKHYGDEFPLLVKLLDVEERLSVQVHPDDETAFDRHNSYGKSEAWYILDADPDAIVYMGFNQDVTPAEFLERCKNGTLEEVLNKYHPAKGDFFFIESGIVHSAGGGLLIAEVQQLSDVTYRIYDWGRENNPATAREMHLEYAFDVIDYKKYDPVKYFVPARTPETEAKFEREIPPRRLARNRFFNITEIALQDAFHVYTEEYESFLIYYCVEGKVKMTPAKEEEGEPVTFDKGEWVLVPASYGDFYIAPQREGTKILEIYVEKQEEKDSYTDEGGNNDGKEDGHSHNHGRCGCGENHSH